MADINKLPVHVGIIMDGNGRWARLRGKERSEGHRGRRGVPRNCTYAADLA